MCTHTLCCQSHSHSHMMQAARTHCLQGASGRAAVPKARVCGSAGGPPAAAACSHTLMGTAAMGVRGVTAAAASCLPPLLHRWHRSTLQSSADARFQPASAPPATQPRRAPHRRRARSPQRRRHSDRGPPGEPLILRRADPAGSLGGCCEEQQQSRHRDVLHRRVVCGASARPAVFLFGFGGGGYGERVCAGW